MQDIKLYLLAASIALSSDTIQCREMSLPIFKSIKGPTDPISIEKPTVVLCERPIDLAKQPFYAHSQWTSPHFYSQPLQSVAQLLENGPQVFFYGKLERSDREVIRHAVQFNDALKFPIKHGGFKSIGFFRIHKNSPNTVIMTPFEETENESYYHSLLQSFKRPEGIRDLDSDLREVLKIPLPIEIPAIQKTETPTPSLHPMLALLLAPFANISETPAVAELQNTPPTSSSSEQLNQERAITPESPAVVALTHALQSTTSAAQSLAAIAKEEEDKQDTTRLEQDSSRALLLSDTPSVATAITENAESDSNEEDTEKTVSKKKKKKKKGKKKKTGGKEAAEAGDVLEQARKQREEECLAIIFDVEKAVKSGTKLTTMEAARLRNDIEANTAKYLPSIAPEIIRKDYTDRLEKLVYRLFSPREKATKVLESLTLKTKSPITETLIINISLKSSFTDDELIKSLEYVKDNHIKGNIVKITNISENDHEKILNFLIAKANILDAFSIKFLLKTYSFPDTAVDSVRKLRETCVEKFSEEVELIHQLDNIFKELLIKKTQKDFLAAPSRDAFISLYEVCSKATDFQFMNSEERSSCALFSCPLPLELKEPMTDEKKATYTRTLEYIENHFKESATLQLRDITIWLTMPIVRKLLSLPVDIESLKATLVEKIRCLEISELSDEDIRQLRERLCHINNINDGYSELIELKPALSESLLPIFRRLQARPVSEKSQINLDTICNILELMNPDHTPEEKVKLVEESIISINKNSDLTLLNKNIFSLCLLKNLFLNKHLSTDQYDEIFTRLQRQLGRLQLTKEESLSIDLEKRPLFAIAAQLKRKDGSFFSTKPQYDTSRRNFYIDTELQADLLKQSKIPLAKSSYSDKLELLFYLSNLLAEIRDLAHYKKSQEIVAAGGIEKKLKVIFKNLPLEIKLFGLFYNYDLFHYFKLTKQD